MSGLFPTQLPAELQPFYDDAVMALPTNLRDRAHQTLLAPTFEFAYEEFLQHRGFESNLRWHELVVAAHANFIFHFQNEAEEFRYEPDWDDMVVYTGIAAFHDCYDFRRVSETNLKTGGGTKDEKRTGRNIHMWRGAQRARDYMQRVHWRGNRVFGDKHIEQAVEFISVHDNLKLDAGPFPNSACIRWTKLVESDFLWVLSPTGPIADCLRAEANSPIPVTPNQSQRLCSIAASNYSDQLVGYRREFNVVDEKFPGVSIVRTRAGQELLARYLSYWRITE